MQRILVWTRRDLRLHDHHALSMASRKAVDGVALLFVFDTTILDRLQDRDDRRVTFIHQSLLEMQSELQKRGSDLIVRIGDPEKIVPEVAKELEAGAVYVHDDYEPSALDRDSKVEKELAIHRIIFKSFKDQVIFHRQEVLSKAGTALKVFTPYKNAWWKKYEETGGDENIESYPVRLDKFLSAENLRPLQKSWNLEKDIGFSENTLWLMAGTLGGRKALKEFKVSIDDYMDGRNIPSLSRGTSHLSVHLRFGTVSIREAFRFAKGEKKTKGSETWMSELIWREFYMMILSEYPHVVQGSFKSEYDKINWPGDPAHFNAWCEGRTGYPIVDAAMRHFKATGWMHNRMRMIVASFLVKDLLIDWRKGEAYFARYLLDFDLSANNGGWQWSASTGCDAQPYFRIFNPTSQSEKFDPEGVFIKKYLPELNGLSSKSIHAPWEANEVELNRAKVEIGKTYPGPIVDHSTQRLRAIALFKR